ncbi:arsenosugar biosynthesis radical SAM (seleno)protein ArsS [Methylomonas sp. HYX-M1]|uniref:arsenosugar biosynthesis radical SAM (seleno)protein ArsS n=1 Tax=Methylomonas sp. HYX-M1 TaxID=3139307 RepID=UPI00345B735F
MRDVTPFLTNSDFPPLRRGALQVLQLNLGYLCNLSCVHCHVDAGPKRKESMSAQTIAQALAFARAAAVHTLDLTGGAPEMHPNFQALVEQAREQGLNVIDRCNLTILQHPDYRYLPAFLAEQRVEIVASLPCYLQDNVDTQRGKGVFADSIAALKHLNRLGYGRVDSGLALNLVYNPQGPTLPPAQLGLEQAYKNHLQQEYGIVFNRLFAMTNMPIQRFGSTLLSQGRLPAYLDLLRQNFRRENLSNLMCLNTLSVDWQGYVYDCDFNQMLAMPLGGFDAARRHIAELQVADLPGAPIATAGHCFGCTAGQGSSCGGALA